MNRITFTDRRGFVVAVIYNEIEDAAYAKEVAAMHVYKKYARVQLERV